MPRFARSTFALALVVCGVLSCSSESPTEPGSIAISVDPLTLAVEQGAAGSVTVELVRTDVTGAVGLTVTGLPAEVTVVIDPPQLTGATLTATATFTVAETAGPGVSTVTIRASAASVEDALATLAFEVVEAPDGPVEGPVWVVPTFGSVGASSSAPARFDPSVIVVSLLYFLAIIVAWVQSPLALLVGTGVAASSAGGGAGAGSSPAAQVVAEGTHLALFTGGYLGNVLSTATLYDHAAGTTHDLTMTAARTQHTQTRLNDGRVLVVGGFGPTPPGAGATTTWSSAELFDPASRAFTATGSMATPRGNHSAALLPDGRTLISGGEQSTVRQSSEIYNPVTGTFAPAANMVAARTLHSATVLLDGRILIAGGQGPAGERYASAEVFDPATGQYSAVASPMSVGHGNGHTATMLADGRVLIVGGWRQLIEPTAAADLFNPATNTFTPAGSMSIPRFGHEAALLADGRVIVVGGQSDEGDVLSSSEIFDPATGIFTPGPEAPGAVFDMASVVLDHESTPGHDHD